MAEMFNKHVPIAVVSTDATRKGRILSVVITPSDFLFFISRSSEYGNTQSVNGDA